jgi:hypothetical protein
MLLATTAVAFAAGLVEGKSVIDHHQKRNSDKDGSNATIGNDDDNIDSVIVPTLVYGVLSLPLSAIGASPSLEMISKITPLSTTLSNIHNLREEEERTTAATTAKIKTRKQPTRRMKLGPETAFDDIDKNTIEHQRLQFNVQKVREENRRTLAATRERRRQMDSEHNHNNNDNDDQIQSQRIFPTNKLVKESSRDRVYQTQALMHGKTVQKQSQLSSNYIATLDGRVLPTRLAEGMRRVRMLVFGYSLINVAIAVHLSSKNDNDYNNDAKGKKNDIEPQQSNNYIMCNKDSTNQLFVNRYTAHPCAGSNKKENMNGSSDNNGGGVTIRLFEDCKRLEDFLQVSTNTTHPILDIDKSSKRKGCILPIVSSTELNWNEVPISTNWFFKYDEDENEITSQPFILLESNICSSSLKECVEQFCENKDTRILWHNIKEKTQAHNSILEGKKIKQIAQRKLFSKAVVDDDSQQNLEVVHIFIGNGLDQNHTLNIMDDKYIYINGLHAIVNRIVEQVKVVESSRIESLELVQDITQSSQISSTPTLPYDDVNQEEKITKSITPLHIVEDLGKNIRQCGQIVANYIGKSVSSIQTSIQSTKATTDTTTTTTLNIFTDDPNMMKWLDASLPKNGINVKLCFHDITTKRFEQDISKDDLFLFACSSDAATINIASAVMSCRRDVDSSHFITLIEKESSGEVMKSLLPKQFQKYSPLCMQSIHEEIFSISTKFLCEGKSVSDTQELMKQF